MSLLLLEGDLLVGLTVGVAVFSSWNIVKRPGILLRGACEVVVELAISGVEEKLAIRKGPIPSWDRLGEEGESLWRVRSPSWNLTPLQHDVAPFSQVVNTGIHLCLRVLRLFLNQSLTCVVYLVIAFELEVSCPSSRLPHLVCI